MTTQEILIDRLIDLAIEEDISTGDISTNAIVPVNSIATAEMKAKQPGVVSGIGIIKKVYEKFGNIISWEPLAKDGDKVEKGDIILRITASYRCLLCGERLLDTRKTAPGLRVLDKMAVRHGGGSNHRIGLYDMIMLKDNHIKIAGGVPQAIEQAKRNLPLSVKLEVETTCLEEVRQAVECGADIIMLDNMDTETMHEAVRIINGRAKTEASGNMNLQRLKEVAKTGVDYISVGALTHSVKAMDISMNIVEQR